MKNSLFKRVVAVAATVPLTLTQGLGVANAIDVTDTTVTLDGSKSALTYIEPGKPATAQSDGYTKTETVTESGEKIMMFEKDSNWNTRLSLILANIAAGDNKTGTLDLSKFYETAVNKSGKYSNVTASLIEKISEVRYVVSDEGDITITASLADITPTFTAGGSNTIGGAMKELAAEYGIDDLDVPDNFFEDVVIGGDLEIRVKSSSLATGTITASAVTFTDLATGKKYEGTGLVDWALEKFDLLKTTAKDACAEYAGMGLDVADAEKEIDDSVSFYVNKLEQVNDLIEKSETFYREVKEYDNISPLIVAADKRLQKYFNRKIQGTTASEVMSSSVIANLYTDIINQLNEKSNVTTFDISAAEVGAFADSFYDVKAGVSDKKATFEAKFADAESAEAETYLEQTYAGVDVTNVYKQINIVVDYDYMAVGGGTVQVDIKRVAEYEEPVVTTTTSTAGPSVVTTTTSTADPSVVTTTTSTADPSIVTTTTSTADPSIVTTTTSTADPSIVTTTTSTAVPPVVTVTTEVVDVNLDIETNVAFYYSIDEEFSTDQIDSLKYSIDKTIITMDEEGNVISEEEVPGARDISISKTKLGFAQTPIEVYNAMDAAGVKEFAHDIAIVATEDIIAADGTVIAKAGETLKQGDNDLKITAYVGVKGDADLNLKADSSDAATVLVWYSKVSTTADKSILDQIKFSNSSLVNLEENPMLDQFAAFLADVNNDDADGNKTTFKSDRKIDASDASFIQVYYSLVSTGSDATWDTWNKVLHKNASAD